MRFLPLCLCVALLALSGCTELNLFRFQNADKESELDYEADRTQEIEFVGEYASVSGNTVVAVHGVGLVVGLDNTGEDPPPSMFRTRLKEDMEKRNVRDPGKLLQSPTTAMVLLTAYLPADIRKGDSFDVEVRLPPNTQASSLAGGWLLDAFLTEQAFVPGQGELKGKTFGKAAGPILVSMGKGENGGVLQRGRILGGGTAFKERNLGLYLRSDLKGVRNTSRIADRIGQRFYYYEHGSRSGLAKAKNDQYVELKVHPRYKDNYPRYIQVVRHISFRETPVQQRDRMERLLEDLLTPDLSAKAAIQYEAIGNESVTFLKKGLNSPSAEVRFYSAEALAYLGDEAGAAELGLLAKNEPAFRVYAVAALAALDEAACFPALKDLLDENSAETRYGAFRALFTMDEEDPFLRGELLNNQFWLHSLEVGGEPMIHFTRYRRPEVVVFGAQQRFGTPLALTAGNHINVNAKAGSETITITRFEPGREDQRKIVSTRVVDVIRGVAELGANYPDVAQMLTQAEAQFNAPGRIEIDALPQPGRLYYRPVPPGEQVASSTKKSARVGRMTMNPNLFPSLLQMGEEPEAPDEIEEPVGDGVPAADGDDTGEASLQDIRKESGDKPEKGKKWSWWPFTSKAPHQPPPDLDDPDNSKFEIE